MTHDTTWKLTWFWTPTSVWCRQHWWLSEATIPVMGSRETIWCRQASTSDLTSGGSGWVDWGDDLIITPHLITSSLTCSSNRCLIKYFQTHYISSLLTEWAKQHPSLQSFFCCNRLPGRARSLFVWEEGDTGVPLISSLPQTRPGREQWLGRAN